MTSPTTNPEPGSKGHPLALRVLDLMRNRSDVDQRFMVEVLQGRLGVGELAGKQEAAAEALRRFLDAREEAKESQPGTNDAARGTRAGDPVREEDPPFWALGDPSRRRYDDFRGSRSDPSEWPSSSFIRKAFDGDWRAAISAVGGAAAIDITSRRLTASGPRFTKAEVLGALQVWVADVDEDLGPLEPLRQADYATWAKAKIASGDPLAVPRLPTIPTIREYVGRWLEVLVALGCQHRSAQSCTASRLLNDGSCSDVEIADGFDLGAAPPEPVRYEWHVGDGTEAARARADNLIAWLRWLADQLPDEERAPLRQADFDVFMGSVRRLSLSRGTPLHPPTSKAIVTCAGINGWNRAKHLAGMVDGRMPAKRSTRPFSERDLIVAVVNAADETGKEMTRSAYTRWRERKLPIDGNAEKGRLPSEGLLRQRLGGGRWEPAVKTALRRAAELGIASTGGASGPTGSESGRSRGEVA